MSEAEKKWPAKLVREKFLGYFASKDHTIGT
jgi:alanyl-tRNA synthetase